MPSPCPLADAIVYGDSGLPARSAGRILWNKSGIYEPKNYSGWNVQASRAGLLAVKTRASRIMGTPPPAASLSSATRSISACSACSASGSASETSLHARQRSDATAWSRCGVDHKGKIREHSRHGTRFNRQMADGSRENRIK